MTNFIKIASFSYPYEYAVLQLLLEQSAIRFFFQNETIIGIAPIYARSNGGIFLKVHPQDVEKAQLILQDFYSGRNLKIV